MSHAAPPIVAPQMRAGPTRTAHPAAAAIPSPANAPVAGHATVFHTVFIAPTNLPHFASLAWSSCPHLLCPPSLSFHFSPASWLSPFLCSGVSGIRPQ